MNWYNENDPKAAAWLRELIKDGHIAPGIVDERPIQEVRADDLREFMQCHFFAGIGGWSYALRLAGWPDDQPVWTGSCPCQPFSSAGKQLGDKDERHLWPVFFYLIRECRPVTVFGEQVASAIGKGWIDGVSADLESEGYACGAAVLGAHSVGAPHIRQRLYWVADSQSDGREQRGTEPDRRSVVGDSSTCRLADSISERGCSGSAGIQNAGDASESSQTDGSKRIGFWDSFYLLPCRDGKSRRVGTGVRPLAHGVPVEWDCCGDMAMRLCRKSRRNSSKRSANVARRIDR